ncbi:NXPE family member 2 [Patella vulgata]|uniref:NXPE family member 2 n=1 Tax=Patella vulgata TaxID=6465 RepID=UPI0021804B42|nr:NXPE family member 2 [Patella vulgata]
MNHFKMNYPQYVDRYKQLINTSLDLSDFIYQLPKDIKVSSLNHGCRKCSDACINVTLTPSPKCRGSQCMCYSQNQIYNHLLISDNQFLFTKQMITAEKMTIRDKRITNETQVPDLSKSVIIVLTGRLALKTKHELQIQLILKDKHGNILKRGGDDVRAWITRSKNKRAMSGRVFDFNNGTYLVRFPTLWNGTNTVSIVIPYYREESATLFRWYRTLNSMYYHIGLFIKGTLNQNTLCLPLPKIIGYQEICNFTTLNDGRPWYCGRPPSATLTCDDFSGLRDYRFSDVGATHAESKLLSRAPCSHTDRNLSVIVNIEGKDISRTNLPLCSNLPKCETWDLSTPTGYFNGSFYQSTKCDTSDNLSTKISKALNKTKLIMVGDSTMQQWFVALTKSIKCKFVSRSVCHRKDWKGSVEFILHAYPNLYSDIKGPGRAKYTIKSYTSIFNSIPKSGRYVVAMHMYGHFARMRYNIFRDTIQSFLPALRNALNRNSELQVLIKGPHVFYCTGWVPCINDFMGRHLVSILHEEMKEFHSRVVYLDYWDMSIAAVNDDIHPPPKFVWNMIEYLFGFIRE